MRQTRGLLHSRKIIYPALILIGAVACVYVLVLKEQLRFDNVLVKSEGQLAERELVLIREKREASVTPTATLLSSPGYEFSRPSDWRVSEDQGRVTLYPPFTARPESRIVVAPYYGTLEFYCMKEISAPELITPQSGWKAMVFAASGECPAISVDENTRHVYVFPENSLPGKAWMIFASYEKEEEGRFLPVLREVVSTLSVF